jgi:hypothetical protein
MLDSGDIEMRDIESPATIVLLGSSLAVLIVTISLLLALPSDQIHLLLRFLAPSALLWFGVYGILEHKRN